MRRDDANPPDFGAEMGRLAELGTEFKSAEYFPNDPNDFPGRLLCWISPVP